MIQIDVSTLVAVVVAAYLVGVALCAWTFWPLTAPGLANNTRASALKTLQVVLSAAVSRWERPSSPTPEAAPEVPESGGYAALPEMERKVVDHIVARLHLGLRQYGPLKVDDPRDWRAEARDEIYDAIVYRALDSMHVDRLDLAKERIVELEKQRDDGVTGDPQPANSDTTGVEPDWIVERVRSAIKSSYEDLELLKGPFLAVSFRDMAERAIAELRRVDKERDLEAAQAEDDRKTSDHAHELGSCSFCDRKDTPTSSGVLGPCQLT